MQNEVVYSNLEKVKWRTTSAKMTFTAYLLHFEEYTYYEEKTVQKNTLLNLLMHIWS